MAYLIDSRTDDATLHATMHGVMSEGDYQFFRERFEENTRHMTDNDPIRQEFLNRAQSAFDNFDVQGLRDSVNIIRDRFGKRWDEDRIMFLTNKVDLQQAKSTMRSYAMISPRMRDLYQRSLISGYNGDFYDEMPDELDTTQLPTYQNIMNGAYVGTEDEDRFITYMDVVSNLDILGGKIFTLLEKEMIMESWRVAEELLDEGIYDPTSPEGDLL